MANPKPTPVRRSVRRPSSSGPPTVVVIVGLLAGVALILFLINSSANKTDPNAKLNAAVRAFENGASASEIDKLLASAEGQASMTAEQRIEATRLRDEALKRDAQAKQLADDEIGNKYVDVKLKGYADRYLKGAPSTPKVRVFITRTNYFLKRWPDHAETAWVKRERDRFKGVIDFNAPPTFEDVAWEAEMVTKSKPRDYTTALASLDAFMETADASDLGRAKALRAELIADREVMHEENMVTAKRNFEYQDDEQKAISRLVWGVIGTGDEAMSNEAATYLLKMPSCDAYLRGYRKTQPLVFERLAAHPLMKDRIAEL